MTDKEAMKLALEALETGINHGVAVDKLRRAIEQAEKQEPVAFKTLSKIGKAVGYWRADLVPPHIRPDSHDITPLYTAPPPRPPLSFEEVEDCFPERDACFEDAYGERHVSPRWLHEFAKAIEAAHGIGKGEA
jgi:hypothetical protein